MPTNQATLWDKAAVVLSGLVIVIMVVSGIWNLVSEDELRATEERIMNAIQHSTEQTNAQMQELRGYITSHFDGHPAN